MNVKRYLYITLLLIWLVVIFLFSNQDAEKSESTSDKVASGIIDITESVTKQEIQEVEKSNFIEQTRFFIRKFAHFTLYFVLGILVYLTLHSYSIKNLILYSILFCFLYACSDEIHQIFSDGRTAKVLDILIDTCGASISIIFVNKLAKNKVIS